MRRPAAGQELLGQVFSIIANTAVDSIPVDSLYERAARGLIASLNDPYAAILSPDEQARFQRQSIGNRYAGIGALVRSQGGHVTLYRVFEGTPAARAGLTHGDRILKVDGRDVSGMIVDSVTSLLLGAPATPVRVTYERYPALAPVTTTVTRGVIRTPGGALHADARGAHRLRPDPALQLHGRRGRAGGHAPARRARRGEVRVGCARQPWRRPRCGHRDGGSLPDAGDGSGPRATPRPGPDVVSRRGHPPDWHRADRRAGRWRLRLSLGNRGGLAAGPRPRPGHRHAHLRQGAGADPADPALGVGGPPHDRQVVHAERALHPGGSWRDGR
ncbi:MAG: PDZ domain-containing protein [Gemmatimonadetes bacterium]|nr:PDZ domain-containing protein [Gemmatimonadota bacterium]